MKIVVTGSRKWTNVTLVEEILKEFPKGTTLIHGGAKGLDKIAGVIGKELGFDVIEVPAEWDKYGRAAGPIRNRKMLDMNPDKVLAFPTKDSVGTKDCYMEAQKRGLKVRIINAKL